MAASLSSVAVCCCLNQVGCEPVISSSGVVVRTRLAVSLSSIYVCCCLDQVGCEPVISSSLEPEVVAMVEVLGTQHEMTVEDLKAGRLYTCSVAASSLKGYGPNASKNVWTKPLGESSTLCCRNPAVKSLGYG